MRIIRASILDLQALASFDRVCFARDGWTLRERIALLTSPASVRLKMVENGTIIGFVVGERAGRDGIAWIRSVGVLPEFRRRGLARQLLHACEARLDAPRLRLYVRASNDAAIRLYAQLGYTPVDLKRGFYRDGEAAVVMERARRHKAQSLPRAKETARS